MKKVKPKIVWRTGSNYPLFDALLDELWQSNEWHDIADEAGISYQTIVNWCEGKTLSPQIRTLTAVANALGFDILLRKRLYAVK